MNIFPDLSEEASSFHPGITFGKAENSVLPEFFTVIVVGTPEEPVFVPCRLVPSPRNALNAKRVLLYHFQGGASQLRRICWDEGVWPLLPKIGFPVPRIW